MTRLDKFNLGLWAALTLAVVAVVVALRCAAGCGPGESAARQAARTAAYVIQSLCAPTATVDECADALLERAEYLDVDGGARE